MQFWSDFVAGLANKEACLPSIRNIVPTHSQWALSLTITFWLGICSLWRHFFQGKLLKKAKDLATKEYGENPFPSFVELPRDKPKLEKLNTEWKKRKRRELKHLEREKERGNDANLRVGKNEKEKGDGNHAKELQNFIDKHENKSKIKGSSMKEWCEQTGWTEEQMESYWMYYWTEVQKDLLIHKYLEEVWKGLTVGFNSLLGCYVMWSQPSFWDTKLLWVDFPQTETWQMTVFYCIGVGYHMHRAVFQFFDHQRKDFVAMVLHHWTTVGLIWLSWHYGLTACGTIVMFCHDATDFFLAAAKISGYHHNTFFKEFFFVCFVLHWIFIRMLLFAKKVVFSCTFDTVPTHSCHWAWYFFIPGLWVLLALHCYWLTFIAAILYRKICLKKSVVDTRSDSDTYDEQ